MQLSAYRAKGKHTSYNSTLLRVGILTQNSLNVEQRKRLTIGVEMAAKPALLLFLDEPTSGLDSQTYVLFTCTLRFLFNCPVTRRSLRDISIEISLAAQRLT